MAYFMDRDFVPEEGNRQKYAVPTVPLNSYLPSQNGSSAACRRFIIRGGPDPVLDRDSKLLHAICTGH